MPFVFALTAALHSADFGLGIPLFDCFIFSFVSSLWFHPVGLGTNFKAAFILSLCD